MTKNKRSIHTLGIVISAVLILLLAGVLYLLFVKEVSVETKYEIIKKNCKSSVKLMALGQKLQVTKKSLKDELDCVTVVETHIFNKDEDKEKIKRDLANSVADCSDMFWHGKYALFSSEDQIFCAVCSIHKFKGEKKGEPITGFSSFMAENNVPGRDEKYLEFITPYSTTPEVQQMLSQNAVQDSIETKYDYAVVFVYAKNSHLLLRTIEKISAGSAAGAGSALVTAGIGFGVAKGAAAIGLVSGVGTVPTLIIIGSSLAIGVATGALTSYFVGTPDDFAGYTIVGPIEEVKLIGCKEFVQQLTY